MSHDGFNRRLLFCVLLFTAAFLLRIYYATSVLKQFDELPIESRSYNIGYMAFDTLSYLEPAAHLRNGEFLKSVSPIRPIVYPAFIALLGGSPAKILNAQALLLSIIPVCVFLLVVLLVGDNWVGFVAGLLSALSPTGIGVASLILSDGLFALFFAVTFVALVYGSISGFLRWIILSATMSCVAILIKPILLFWPVVSVVCFLVIAICQDKSNDCSSSVMSSIKCRMMPVMVLLVLPVLVIFSWSTAQYHVNGVFTVSTIGKITLREYLAIRTEEWGIAGHMPSADAIKDNRVVTRERFESIPVEQRPARYTSESVDIFKKYPVSAVKAFLRNALENTVSGWDFFSRQLPFTHNNLGMIMGMISRGESIARMIALVVMLLAPFVGYISIRGGRSTHDRMIFSIILVNTLVFFYFVTMSGVTFWTGPRILYPAEIIEISTAALLCVLMYRRRRAQQAV